MENNRDLLNRCRQTVSEIETLMHSACDSPVMYDAFMRLRFAVKEVTRRVEIQLTQCDTPSMKSKESRKPSLIGIENASIHSTPLLGST